MYGRGNVWLPLPAGVQEAEPSREVWGICPPEAGVVMHSP